MSDYGFNLFSDNGLLNIDSNFQNFHLRKSGILTDTNFGFGDAIANPVAEISIKGMNTPIIVLCPRTYGDYMNTISCYTYFRNLQGEDAHSFMFNKWWNFTGVNFEYFIFDNWRPPITDKYGMNIYNANGEVIYHSGWYRLKMLGYVTPDLGSAPSLTRDSTIDVGRYSSLTNKPGILMPMPRMAYSEGHSGTIFAGSYLTYGYIFVEGIYMSDKNTVRTRLIMSHGSEGWWEGYNGWITPPDTFMFVIDLDGMPLNYNGN